MAIDCHDCYECDFRCEDCLADETKKWFKENFNVFVNYSKEFEKYKIALQKIANYSSESGQANVRFEMSGEGNPDFYPYRNEIVEYAYNLGMKPVYITSGSFVDDRLCQTLVQYCSYIRISLPGINNETYKHYSGQNRFLFDDSIRLVRKLVELRRKLNRENDLLIGVRCCMRPEFICDIKKAVDLFVDNVGVDSFQIVRAIKNNYHTFAENSNKVPESFQEILRMLGQRRSVSIPDNVTVYYNTRATDPYYKETRCFASELTPILYSNFLLPCTHTRIIKSVGVLGTDLSIADINSMANTAETCQTCCAIKDNSIFNEIYDTVKEIIDSGKSPEFHCY